MLTVAAIVVAVAYLGLVFATQDDPGEALLGGLFLLVIAGMVVVAV